MAMLAIELPRVQGVPCPRKVSPEMPRFGLGGEHGTPGTPISSEAWFTKRHKRWSAREGEEDQEEDEVF